jgi:hypothetical protein
MPSRLILCLPVMVRKTSCSGLLAHDPIWYPMGSTLVFLFGDFFGLRSPLVIFEPISKEL